MNSIFPLPDSRFHLLKMNREYFSNQGCNQTRTLTVLLTCLCLIRVWPFFSRREKTFPGVPPVITAHTSRGSSLAVWEQQEGDAACCNPAAGPGLLTVTKWALWRLKPWEYRGQRMTVTRCTGWKWGFSHTHRHTQYSATENMRKYSEH